MAMDDSAPTFVIIHNRLNWFWGGPVRWVNSLGKARVYRTRHGAMKRCRWLNKQYGAVTAQCLTVDEARAKIGE